MASRGRGCRGRPWGTGQAPPTFDQPPVFDQQAFAEAVGVAAAAIAQASIAGSQGGPSNLQRFRAHHPPTFTGGGDPMVANHWFMQIENVLEAMKITSDTTRVRLAAFQLEGEARVWWRWVRTSRDLEVMTWAEFQELFMGKYFLEIARHAKAQEFLELKQGATTVMDYVARFTELARFADDYVATDLAKVRRFENGLKLSIRARIVGFRLQDMDSMVGTALTIEREIEDSQSTRDASVSGKRKDSQSSSNSGKRQRASSSQESNSRCHPGQGHMRVDGQAGQMRVAGQAGQMVCYHCQQPGHMRQDCPQRQGSQGFGTSHSQSVAGQERIQYIPPQHGIGQRGLSQFQGATQAPHISQADPRGQSMGRGRGRGPQAGTSGVQGCVYAVTPQAESTDQPVIQGTFLLSRLWARVLFDSGASHSFIAASVVIELGLEVETLEEPLYVSYPLRIRARIGMICRGCELEISRTLLTVDLRIMDISEFDVILTDSLQGRYRL